MQGQASMIIAIHFELRAQQSGKHLMLTRPRPCELHRGQGHPREMKHMLSGTYGQSIHIRSVAPLIDDHFRGFGRIRQELQQVS